MAYTIQIDAGTPASLASLGVMSGWLSLVANGFDSLDLEIDASLDAAAVFASASKLTLRDGSTIRFVGEVIDDPRESTATEGPTHRYRVLSYLARLEHITFGQDTKVYRGDPAALGNVYDPLVTLGQDADGVRCTTAAQIAAVIDFAVLHKSVPLTYVSETWPAGFEAPLDQRENCSCWEAIVCQLRWMPNYVLCCDYSSGATVVQLIPSASLSAVSLAADGGILSSASFTPRRDLQLAGCRCLFRRTDEYDGKEREVRTFQTAGDPDAATARDLFIDLEGGSSTTISQKIKVAAYPSFDSSDYSGDVRAWLKGRVPWLADIADADWEITAIVRSGTEEYENELIEGSITSWMPVSEEAETITCTVDYATKDDAGKYVDKATIKLPVAVLSTNGSSKTYKKKIAYQAPETAPAGLAAGIYASWSVLQWDGSFSSDVATVGWTAVPGAKLSITGGPTAWATMGATVQSFSVELADGSCSIRAGTCRALEADSLTALYRALRGRRIAWKRRSTGTDAEAPAAIDGPETFPSDASADSPAFARRFLRISAALDEVVNDVTIDPAAIVYDDEDNAGAQDIKLREVVIASIDAISGKPVAKRVQALCGAPYGDEIPLGGGAAEDPGAAIDTIGAASEGTETASTATWTAGATNGLAEWYVSRVVYNHAGNKILYAFLRKRTYDKFGRLYSVGAETRVIVDEPAVLS